MEKIVTFLNKNNQKLFGVLHIPDHEVFKEKIGINLLNPGLKNRVAPHRMNIKIARRLCRKGFYVLRFDPFGVGDSEGEISDKNELSMDIWGQVQEGLFVQDTLSANEFFKKEVKLSKLLLMGQCGGAATALLSSDNGVESLVLIDLPVRKISSKIVMSDCHEEIESPGKTVTGYLSKVFKIRPLLKLIQGKVPVSHHLKILAISLASVWKKALGRQIKEINVSDRFSYMILDSFLTFMKREKEICFIFAENDFSLKEFRQDLQDNYINGNQNILNKSHIHVVKDANHIYTEFAWQADLLENIEKWCDRYVPASA